ncbi:MAG: hypothetical protein ACT4ON_11135 [Bacteroidota bacterium]
MNPLDFFPYHNRHITFEYRGETKHGVVIDSIPYNLKRFSTEYIFIPTPKMKSWKDAQDRRDKNEMEKYEEKIDILDIKNPSFVRHVNS